MKKLCKVLGNIFYVIVIILSIVVTLISIITNTKDSIPNINGYSPFSLQSNSMYPTLKKGDLIITDNNINIRDLKVDDIISFFSLEDGNEIVKTHRIINIIKEDGLVFYETKGDNNDVEDTVLVTDIDIIGKYKTRIPYLGYLVDFVKNKWVFFFIILIPLAIIFILQLVEFIKLLIDYKLAREER